MLKAFKKSSANDKIARDWQNRMELDFVGSGHCMGGHAIYEKVVTRQSYKPVLNFSTELPKLESTKGAL